MATNGNNIIIKLGGTAIAATKSNEITVESELLEISSPTIGQWRSYIAGRKEWSINTSFLVTSPSDVASRLYVNNALTVGQTYTLTICMNDNTGTVYLTGSAILKTYKVTATRGNLMTGSFGFVGVGALALPSNT